MTGAADPTTRIPAVDTGLNRTLAVLIGGTLAVGGGAMVDLLVVVFLAALVCLHRVKRLPDPAIAFLGSLALALIPAWMVTPGSSREVWAAVATLLAAFGLYAAGLNSTGLLRFLVLGLYAGSWLRIAIGTGFESSLAVAGLILVLGAWLEPGRFRRWCLGTGLVVAALASWNGDDGVRFAAIAGVVLFGLLTWRDLHPRTFRPGVIGLAGALALVAILAAGTQIRSLVVGDGIVLKYVEHAWSSASAVFPFGAGMGRASGLAAELGMLGLAAFAAMIALPLWRSRRLPPTLARRILASVLPASLVLLIAGPLHGDRAFLLLLGATTALVKSAVPATTSRIESVRQPIRAPEAVPCGA